MLVIRTEQMRALSEVRELAVSDELAGLLRKHWPVECAALGPTALLQRVRLGIECARRYGLREQQDLARYLNLMFLLGDNFDTDPRYPWAAAFLNDRGVASIRMEQLCRYAIMMVRREAECPDQSR